MKKFQISVKFRMDDEFMTWLPSHRMYINLLIEKGIIDHYVVAMDAQRLWITVTAESKERVLEYISASSIFKYWTFEIDELLLFDGQQYRLPAVQLN